MRVASIICLLAVLVVTAPADAQGTSSAGDDVARAVRLYDEGRYDDARPILESLDAEGRIDGPLLYRLYYCRLRNRDARARDTLARALEQLQAELETSESLEVPFYLANAHINSGRRDEALRVATAAVERVESGSMAAPETPLEAFRLGKLYADLERAEGAEHWYRTALEGFSAEPESAPRPYIDWAGAWLAEQALATGDDRAIVESYKPMLESGEGTMDDWDRLATAHARLGEWKPAADAWRRAERANPAEANRARYCYRLADLAAAMVLPETLPDGRAIAELDQAGLQEAIAAQATALREVQQEAASATRWKKKQRRKLQARIDEIRGTFVALTLRYALERHGLREAAFFGGWAPLIFRPREWNLPEPGTAEPEADG